MTPLCFATKSSTDTLNSGGKLIVLASIYFFTCGLLYVERQKMNTMQVERPHRI
jgi:hypothetical protein